MRPFKDGDIVEFIGYRQYQSTYGILFEQNGLLYMNAIVKENGIVKTKLWGIVMTPDGRNVDDKAYDQVIRHASKAEYSRWMRYLRKGIVSWNNGS